MVVNLTTYQASLQTYPILGGISTDVVTGNVLGVSPDSRYVVLSDGTYVFLIDTTGSKVATRYSIPNIDAVTFAPDGSNMWIAANPPAGDTTSYAGVYVFSANTWVKTSNNISTHVKALAWMPDGQSYFASGDQMVNYSTCITPVTSPSKLPLPVPLPLGTATTGPINLDTTVIGSVSSSVSSSPPGAVPEVVGLSATSSGSEWLDYTVTVSSEVPLQTAVPTPSALTFGGAGNVCLSTVTVNTPTSTPAALPCTPTQVTFSPRLEAEFVTGMDTACQTPDAAIHGYNITTHLLTPSIASTSGSIIPLSGGILSDGRKLFVGTQNSTAGTAALHRFDLSTGAATTGTLLDGLLKEDLSVPVELIPSFVAVVPK
jgi:hypothetical protein